jgi:hypothetical protein
VLTTTFTDSAGAFSADVTIPADYSGAHTLAAVGLGPDQVTLPITIAAAPASSTGGLALTGAALTTTIGLAPALLAIGAAAARTSPPTPPAASTWTDPKAIDTRPRHRS